MLFGAHVPAAAPLAAAAARGAELVQVFLSAPRAWRPPVPRSDAEVLRASPVPIYVHAPYLINVATTDAGVRERSRASLHAACEAAASIGAAGVVAHRGQLPAGVDPAVGVAHWRETLEALPTGVPVLIENTAGGQNAMARTVAQIERLWEGIAGLDLDVGFCLDTCHLHAAGEDLVAATTALRGIVGEIALTHVNDSRDDAGCGRDRHANLGRGRIDPEALVEAVRVTGAPVVVETPGEPADQAADLAWLRERLGDAGAGVAAASQGATPPPTRR